MTLHMILLFANQKERKIYRDSSDFKGKNLKHYLRQQGRGATQALEAKHPGKL